MCCLREAAKQLLFCLRFGMKAVKQLVEVNQTEFNDGSVVEKKPALILVIEFPAGIKKPNENHSENREKLNFYS
jgi:hypothetical protein